MSSVGRGVCEVFPEEGPNDSKAVNVRELGEPSCQVAEGEISDMK